MKRYLEDVTRAHETLKRDNSVESDHDEYFPDTVGQEETVTSGQETWQHDSGGAVQWESVPSDTVPVAGNNITISFQQNSSSNQSTPVPVLSPPSRDEMGVDKVRRLRNTDHQTPVYGGSVDLGPHMLTLVTAPVVSSGLQSHGQHSSTQLQFSPTILRPLSVLPAYPVSTWSPAPLNIQSSSASCFPMPQLPQFPHIFLPETSELK